MRSYSLFKVFYIVKIINMTEYLTEKDKTLAFCMTITVRRMQCVSLLLTVITSTSHFFIF